MDGDTAWDRIRLQLARPQSVEAVRGALAELDRLAASPSPPKRLGESVGRAFDCLRELTAAEPAQAVPILTDDLLPRCLSPGCDDDVPGASPTGVFGEWLEDLPEDEREQVRAVAVPRAVAALGGPDPDVRHALGLLGSMGWWDGAVVAALDRIALGRDDETGDHALAVRLRLRPESDQQVLEPFREVLHRRIAAERNFHLMHAARAVGTEATAGLVWSHWVLAHPDGGGRRPHWVSFACGVLVAVAAREGRESFTRKVWGWFLDLSRTRPAMIDDPLALDGTLTGGLDLPDVVAELTRRSNREEGHSRYLHYLRALECCRPSHPGGWDAVADADLAAARGDAVAPSAMRGRYSTPELSRKEAAWDVLLCRGDAEALDTFGDSLRCEEGGYAAHLFMDLAGCLALDPLPREVGDIIAAAPGRPEWPEQERLVAQVGAIQAAHGSGSPGAFAALLGYRRVGAGVLVSVINALAGVAEALAASGDAGPLATLFEAAESAPGEDTRGAAAGAVSILLEGDRLTGEHVSRAAALAASPGTDPYARQELLYSFAARPPEDVPTHLREFATGLLDLTEPDENRDPRPAALALLAGQPDSRGDVGFLTGRLGLVVGDGGIAAGPDSLLGVVPHVLGRYFAAEPERFAAAVAAVVSDGGISALAHILRFIERVGPGVPCVVVDALVARLRRSDDGRVAELPLLATLAAVAPGRLVTEGCAGTGGWVPQARAALADTLGGLALPPGEAAAARFGLLTRLAGDGVFAVRRAAYRAAAVADPVWLRNLVAAWAISRERGGAGLRRRAAEAAGWLGGDIPGVVAALGSDPEPGVREAFRQATAAREERSRSRAFEDRVLAVREPGEVVRAWRYGVTLSRVGDDTTLRRIDALLAGDLPPAVRFWLARVRKAVEKRWGDVTRKWPEPWHARPGRLEAFSGVIERDGGGEVPVSGTLWLAAAETPGGRSSWGGWASSDGRSVDDGRLCIPGRRPSGVMVTNAFLPAGEFVFVGRGYYPE